jgi:hypothetical protein
VPVVPQGPAARLRQSADWEPEALLEGVLMTDEQRCLCRQVRRLDWLKAWIGHCELMVGQAQIDFMCCRRISRGPTPTLKQFRCHCLGD